MRQGFKAAEDALQQVPDMRGIFAINDPSGLGAVGALEKAGKLEQVTVIAFDGMPAGKQHKGWKDLWIQFNIQTKSEENVPKPS